MEVPSGRPWSSSSAWAPTPTARRKATSVAANLPPSNRGAMLAPIATYDRCHKVYGGWSNTHQSAQARRDALGGAA